MLDITSELPNVDLSLFKINSLSFDVIGDEHGGQILISMEIPDIYTGRPSTVITKAYISKREIKYLDRDYINKYIRSLVHKAVLHEVDECLLIDGERIFNPHKNEKL